MGRGNKKKKDKTSNSNANKSESSKQTNNSTQKKNSISKTVRSISELSNSENISKSTSREDELLNNETVSKSEKLDLDKSSDRDDQVEKTMPGKQDLDNDRRKTRKEHGLQDNKLNIKRNNQRQDYPTLDCHKQRKSSDQKCSRHTEPEFKDDGRSHGKDSNKWNERIGDGVSNQPSTSKKYFRIFYPAEKDEFDKFQALYIKNKDAVMDFKVVREIFGDLFTAGEDYSLGHCVAEDMSMGSGIAVSFRRDFKRVDELLNQRKTQGEMAVLQDKQRYIYYLVTKRISSGKPTYSTLWSSLKEMQKHILSYDVRKLALPRIGCGLDGLEWDYVKKMLEYIFHDVDIEIVIYNFQQDDLDAPAPGRLRKCRVFNADYPISKIESGTMIVYFGSEDNQPTEELKMMNQAFPSVIRHYRMEKKEVGNFVFFDRNNDRNAFYGCIVRKKCTDPIDFTYFQKCLNLIQSRNRQDKYEYIAFEAFVEKDGDDGMTVSKILNLMRYSLTFVDVYVCWPEHLKHLKPRV